MSHRQFLIFFLHLIKPILSRINDPLRLADVTSCLLLKNLSFYVLSVILISTQIIRQCVEGQTLFYRRFLQLSTKFHPYLLTIAQEKFLHYCGNFNFIDRKGKKC